jgi:hypothetical protein
MKKVTVFLAIFLVASFASISQNLENIDFIAPFSDDVAAVKKGNSWGFINKNGDLTIPFRDDVVVMKGEKYPSFHTNRCLIKTTKDNIELYGYIDKNGKTVIKPQFLNASNFMNNHAVVLKLDKEDLGKNNVLNKNVISYSYANVLIDTDGKILQHLTKYKSTSATSKFLKNPPKITAKVVSDKAFAVQDKNGKWMIKKVE